MAPFISFEGIDGCGKTTQIKLLEESLRSRGIPVIIAREPGGTAVGDLIRRVLLDSKTVNLRPISELLLYYASRHQNLYQTILPALESGHWVLCDRYADASMAYQGYGRQIDLDTIEELNRIVIGCRMPDMTILLDIDPRVSLERAKVRNRQDPVDEGRFERESLEFYDRVRQGYLAMAMKEHPRFRVLEGNQPIDILHQEVVKVITPLLEGQSAI
jgi:dTMP kinase